MSGSRDSLLLEALGRVPCTRNKLERLPLEVAGVRVDLLLDAPGLVAPAGSFFREYSGQGPASAFLFVHERGESELGNGVWDEEDSEFHVHGDFGESVVQRDFAACRTGPGEARAIVAPGVLDSIHNLLRWFLPELLAESGALLMHASGVIRDGEGYVFFGESGAGKSTTAALIAGADPQARLIGDDAVILRVGSGEFPVVHSAPLGGGRSLAPPPRAQARLRGLYRLNQLASGFPCHRLVPLAPPEGVAQVLANAMSPDSRRLLETGFEVASALAARAPGVWRMEFTKDAGFWDKVLETGKAGVA